METIVIINENHRLLPEQEETLLKKTCSFANIRGGVCNLWGEGAFSCQAENCPLLSFLRVPAKGWTREEMDQIAKRIHKEALQRRKERKEGRTNVVFVSPVPYLLSLLTFQLGGYYGEDAVVPPFRVFLFHNDRREKKELPNGKIIFTIPPEGWELVEVGG